MTSPTLTPERPTIEQVRGNLAAAERYAALYTGTVQGERAVQDAAVYRDYLRLREQEAGGVWIDMETAWWAEWALYNFPDQRDFADDIMKAFNTLNATNQRAQEKQP